MEQDPEAVPGLTRSKTVGSSAFREYKVINGRVRRQKKELDSNQRISNAQYGSEGYQQVDGTQSVEKNEGFTSEHEEPWSLGKDCRALKRILKENPINVLLLLVPFAMASGYMNWGVGFIFTLNFLAILALAAVLGAATEELAACVGDTIGGLLNATFGNAVELILAVYALREGLVDVVQDSLLGSILSNLLLVLGMCFFFGGLKFHTQRFNPDGARMQSSLLLLAVLALAVPTMVMAGKKDGSKEQQLEDSLFISHGAALVLASLYIFYLLFQLCTHPEQFAGEGAGEGDEGSGEHVEIDMSFGCAFVLLAVVTGFVAICSEFLVGTVEEVTETWHISRAFVGVVLLPIVGNAAEHATAVTVAFKDKMDLSLGVALGSSTQIALFVVPFTVVAGWCIDVPMDLNFKPVATGILLLTVLIVCSLTQDGNSNWMEGVMLLAAYFLIAVTFARI